MYIFLCVYLGIDTVFSLSHAAVCFSNILYSKTIAARAAVYPCLYMMSYTHKRMHPIQVVVSLGLKCVCVCVRWGGGGVAQLVECRSRKPDAILMRV